MENIICNPGFCVNKNNLTNKELKTIKDSLKVTPESGYSNFIKESFNVFRETSNYLVLPIYYALNNLGLNGNVSFNNHDSIDIEDTITLRENQKECYGICCKEKEKDFGGGIINLTTASGKTVVSIKLISFFNLKTLILVNKIELMEQWRKELVKWVPGIRIGTIQGSKFDIEDKDVVIGMLQTIAIKQSLRSKDFSWVGVTIIDEVHNISSSVFSNVLFKVRSKYVFGLTATLERKDKLEKVIKWGLGDVLFSNVSSETKQSSEIHVYKYRGVSSVEHFLGNGTVAVSRMLTDISEDRVRTDMIINVINKLLKEKERNILVISDRVSQLKYINRVINGDSGLFIGGMKSQDLDISKTKRVVLGTYALVNEGFNLPKLNCIVFATPRSSITQSIGRIYRKPHSIRPIIIDILDDFSIFKAQYYKRLRIYKKSIKDMMILSMSGNKCIHDEPTEEHQADGYLFLDD